MEGQWRGSGGALKGQWKRSGGEVEGIYTYIYYKNIYTAAAAAAAPPCRIIEQGVNSYFTPAGRKEGLYSRRA